ncbi:cation transporter [Alteribacter lacisalsi]|uniref:Cation transporter n=1 Tax=Alteribacter lacisalsi TaxID=2045244 RepID=A0A2W0HVK4_9BACI|nr:sodium:calcium antiporter [Alteribacter lacisalsi]PYZ97718.1 cation transporter [Alteribacter lacisalsi]
MDPFVLFAITAAVTVYAAVKLSVYADVISERTSLGGMMVGMLLLAGATSLPEVTTSTTAILVGSPDIAVGNVLGSNLFNLLILAVFDIVYRRRKLLAQVHSGHQLSAVVGLGLMGLVLITILVPTGITIFGIGIEMFAMVIFYVYAMREMSAQERAVPEIAAASEEDSAAAEIQGKGVTLRAAKWGFAASALIIFASGSLLTIAGDQIAVSTGIDASFVGSFLIAAATSLPEVVTVLVALRLANYNLAVGNILGSNVFNMLILVLADVLFRGGPILEAVSPGIAVTALFAIMLNLIVIAHLLYARYSNRRRLYVVPSIVLIVVYFVATYVMF